MLPRLSQVLFTFASILWLFLCFFDVSLAKSHPRVEEKDTTDFENRGGESHHGFVIFVHHIWQFRVNSSPIWRDERNTSGAGCIKLLTTS